jgi:hypothetical protein
MSSPPRHEEEPAVAESENVYVKIGERGRLIERTATSPRDHVNLQGTGWVRKGSKGAPTKKDAWGDEPVKTGLTDLVPTSVKAYAEAADADPATTTRTRTTGRGSSTSAGSAGEAADAASQSAAGR